MSVNKEEIARDIILKMIEHGKIERPKCKGEYNSSEANDLYVSEVCKAFKTVCKTVSEVSIGKWDSD